MNSQNESAKVTSGNTSELEMVGTLLFGSITDENAESSPRAGLKSENHSRKVNLGARIAPETSRQWEASEPEVVLTSQDVSTISEILPERQNPTPISSVNTENSEKASVSEVESAIHPVRPRRKNDLVMRIYGTSLTLMTLCVLVLGWQLFVGKNGESQEAVQPVSPMGTVVKTEAPMVPTIEEPTLETSESAFASMPVEDAGKLAESEPLPTPMETVASLPDVNASVGTEMNDAPVFQPYGDSVTISEEIPTFNADLASMAPSTSPLNSSAAPVASVQNVDQASQTVETASWNAGETMEEIPVFNSELSDFSSAPQVAPLAPQVGSMAPMPTTRPQYTAQVQSPHKLTPPTSGHTDSSAAVQPSAQISSESAAEEYPTFNPNLGVDGALPVSYY